MKGCHYVISIQSHTFVKLGNNCTQTQMCACDYLYKFTNNSVTEAAPVKEKFQAKGTLVRWLWYWHSETTKM